MVEHTVGGVEFLVLPCLALGRNSNLTSDDMDDLQRHGIYVGDNNYPAPEKISNEVPQPGDGYSWI